MATTNYQIASRRAADRAALIGQPWNSVYASFLFHEIAAPPVWDSHAEKVRRKADALSAEANRLGQSELTPQQAGKVLGIKANRVPGAITQIVKRGYDVPPVVAATSPETSESVEMPSPSRLCGVIDPWNYPAGLPVLASWAGPGDGERTYLLR